MDKIDDMRAYLSGMSTTLRDKCWWIDKIPAEIDTVVDYGCAQGDLAIMIDSIAPNRFSYIGVDNSEEMLALARHNFGFHHPAPIKTCFFRELSEAACRCDPAKTVLVLNSVMHEIFSYLTPAEQKILFIQFFDIGFRAIAIRDMYVPSFDSPCAPAILEKLPMIQNSRHALLWKEFYRAYPYSNVLPVAITEFLLKYRYVSNWSRELKEVYLWPWLTTLILDGYLDAGSYRKTEDESFGIPFIQKKIREDFGFDWPYMTHRKVLLCKEEGGTNV